MALLDLQSLDTPAKDSWGEGGSELSVTLCDSVASILLCL
jgi:hypothetical protein